MYTRREMLAGMGTGLGAVGLASVLSDELAAAPRGSTLSNNPLALKPPHFAPRAKRIIHLYMNGGPSQVDTFDHKPALATHKGQRPMITKDLKTENGTGGMMPSTFKFERRGESGLPISELYRETGRLADSEAAFRKGCYSTVLPVPGRLYWPVP